MNHHYLTGIIFYEGANPAPRKYHDITNSETRLQQFLQFAGKDKRANYVNFYFKTTHPSEKGRNFAFRRYVERR